MLQSKALPNQTVKCNSATLVAKCHDREGTERVWCLSEIVFLMKHRISIINRSQQSEIFLS
jgi:hypothetical protein